MTRVRVIGCGNEDAGDDALGIMAVRAAGAELVELEADVVPQVAPLAAVHLLEDVDVAILVDAIRTSDGSRAVGELVRLEAAHGVLPGAFRSSLSSHGLGLPEVVALASVVGAEPAVVVLGLEAGEARIGASLTPEVRAALPALREAILAEVRAVS
jgi:hydrogenase maturation protease